MNDQQQWRIFYTMIVSWNYHPRATRRLANDMALEADWLLENMKKQEKLRWPDGQPSGK